MTGAVYVVDDDVSFQTSIESLLKRAGCQVATFSFAHRLLDRPPNQDQPGRILLGLRLSGLDGPDLQTRLKELGFPLPIVFLTGSPDVHDTVQAIKAGADDILIKPVKSSELPNSVERALVRYRKSRASKVAFDGDRIRFLSLTPRERQVFRLVVRGNANKQIAHGLGTTARTVKVHRARVMEKMAANSLAELVSCCAPWRA